MSWVKASKRKPLISPPKWPHKPPPRNAIKGKRVHLTTPSMTTTSVSRDLKKTLQPGVAYKRLLLKLAGEALVGEDSYGINRTTIQNMVADVAEVARMGVELAVVIGGGNIFRGVAPGAQGMDRATADYMGML